MTLDFEDRSDPPNAQVKHPEVRGIEDVITFRLQRLVAIGERAGDDWSQRLFNLSLNEWRLLALIRARAPSRAGDMADLLLMDKSQMSRVIKSLLGKALIRSFPDPADGRASALELTAEGIAVYVRVFDEVMQSNERILSVLSAEEVSAFSATLEKLISHSSDLLETRLGRQLVR